MDVITDALKPLGLTRADIDFTCLGSCDYITGQAFSFVSNLDAIGAWPPKRDSHVEMDGAWALYEAWLRLQEGDIDIAVVTGSGRSSTGDPGPHLSDGDGSLLPRPARRRSAHVRRAPGPRGDRRRHRRRARDGRGRGPRVAGQAATSTAARRRLRARAAAPPRRPTDHRRRRGDGARPGDRARELVDRPAYITGFDHRTECHNPSFRSLADSPSTRIAAAAAGLGDGPVEVAELQAAFTHEELLLRHGARPRRRRRRERVGRGAARQPDHGHRACAASATPPTTSSAAGTRALAHSTSGPCLQQNLICILEGSRR